MPHFIFSALVNAILNIVFAKLDWDSFGRNSVWKYILFFLFLYFLLLVTYLCRFVPGRVESFFSINFLT